MTLVSLCLAWGTADTEIKDLYVENQELKVSLFKSRSRLEYSHACFIYPREIFLEQFFICPVHSSLFIKTFQDFPPVLTPKKEYKPWKWGATARYYASYTKTVTNEEVRAKIQQAIGPHEDLTIVKRRNLQWHGHVSRSSGVAKTILQDTVKGGRRQGRQRKRWEDSIREWTGLEFAKSQRAVENRKKNGGNW